MTEAPNPNSASALITSAALHYNRGQYKEAARLCDRILKADAYFFEALHLGGLSALALKDIEGARKLLSRAAALSAEAGVLVDLAEVLIECDDLDGAIQSCRHALVFDPALAEAHHQLGMALHWSRKFTEAIPSLREAVRLKPEDAYMRVDLGRALLGAGDYRAARAELEPLVGGKSAERNALVLCGIACHQDGDFPKAIECLEKALTLDPESSDMLLTLANVHRDAGDFAQAQERYERALAVAPGNMEARNDYAHALLAQGRFERGWDLYESRWEANRRRERLDYPQRPWQGESLAGKRLLVWDEAGIGEQIMYAGMIPEILEAAAGCAVVCEPKLAPLFARSFAPARVAARGSEAHAALLEEPFDYQIPIASLGQHFRRSFADFPQHTGYLRADEAKVAAWKERLAALGPGRKIAISWKGGFVGTRRHLRSIDLEAWLPILKTPGVEFISLQYTEGAAAEVEALREKHGIKVHHWPEVIADYDETAALVCAVERVVSVCTALIHLTGGLGRQVWVLVPAVPEWRYMREGERMPWYPSARLLRQPHVGDWGSVIERAAGMLRG